MGQKRDLISERGFILRNYILTSTQENGRKMCYFFVPILNRNKEVKSVVRAKKVKSSDKSLLDKNMDNFISAITSNYHVYFNQQQNSSNLQMNNEY